MHFFFFLNFRAKKNIPGGCDYNDIEAYKNIMEMKGVKEQQQKMIVDSSKNVFHVVYLPCFSFSV